jgi:hypothetical protein
VADQNAVRAAPRECERQPCEKRHAWRLVPLAYPNPEPKQDAPSPEAIAAGRDLVFEGLIEAGSLAESYSRSLIDQTVAAFDAARRDRRVSRAGGATERQERPGGLLRECSTILEDEMLATTLDAPSEGGHDVIHIECPTGRLNPGRTISMKGN